MKVLLLIFLALLVLGICFVIWRKRKSILKLGLSKSPQPSLRNQPSTLKPGETRLPSPSPITDITEQQDFSELRSQLEELAKRGWAKDETSWYSTFSLSLNELTDKIAPAQAIEILLTHARRVTAQQNLLKPTQRRKVQSFVVGQAPQG
ncbi:hypothetical protein ACE1B6_29785 [Aerosakkonemataceae cyanobacterium BLCC-F154]|uniref:Uncharacterized protein n=1 Tax=Floridaenema fluviatile BLCC-F154 TaxID=3153640 RepID=A0ABV4YLV0_9CYAN